MIRRRHTRQRQVVLDAVRARYDHPSADDIYLDVRTIDSKLGRGTVYRNLNLLSELGEITHVRVPGADRYDSRTDLHYHLICNGCGAVSDVAVPYRNDLDSEVSEATGFHITRHRTIFEGLCPQCQRKGSVEKGNEPSGEAYAGTGRSAEPPARPE